MKYTTYVVQNIKDDKLFLNFDNQWVDIKKSATVLLLSEAQKLKQGINRCGYHAKIIKDYGHENAEIIF